MAQQKHTLNKIVFAGGALIALGGAANAGVQQAMPMEPIMRPHADVITRLAQATLPAQDMAYPDLDAPGAKVDFLRVGEARQSSVAVVQEGGETCINYTDANQRTTTVARLPIMDFPGQVGVQGLIVDPGEPYDPSTPYEMRRGDPAYVLVVAHEKGGAKGIVIDVTGPTPHATSAFPLPEGNLPKIGIAPDGTVQIETGKNGTYRYHTGQGDITRVSGADSPARPQTAAQGGFARG